jgi:transposase
MEISPKAFQELLALVDSLRREIDELKKENLVLKERIHELEHPKNSGNSSIPPSKDDNRIKRNQSLRAGTGKKSGGQPGHKGHTLEMVATPDEIIHHKPSVCKSCGRALSGLASTVCEARQVVEIPPIQPIHVEHRRHSTVCTCGCLNRANFPERVKSPIQYGETVESLVTYLSVGQYIPYNRIVSMLSGLFHIPLSEGSVSNIINRFANRAKPFYEQIRKEIEASAVVGADETGARMNGEKWWFWTWQNNQGTYTTASRNRAFATVDANFPEGFPKAVLVSDRYGAHLKTEAYAHQLCISHLFRDLNYLIELTGAKALKRVKELLRQAVFLKSQLRPVDYQQPNPVRSYIRRETLKVLLGDHCNEHRKVRSLMKALSRSKNHIFEFLYHEHVQPDNNASERAIRNVKVKQKVSTMFKSELGIANYAIIRSVFDTCAKRNIPALHACKIINQYPE